MCRMIIMRELVPSQKTQNLFFYTTFVSYLNGWTHPTAKYYYCKEDPLTSVRKFSIEAADRNLAYQNSMGHKL